MHHNYTVYHLRNGYQSFADSNGDTSPLGNSLGNIYYFPLLINSNTSTFNNILYVYYCIPTDHCHATRSTAVDVQAKRKLIIASILCLVFMVGEAVGKLVVPQIFYYLNIIHVILIQKLL